MSDAPPVQDTVSYWRVGPWKFQQTRMPNGFTWECLPPGVYESQDNHERIEIMPQEFMVQKFAPTSGAASLAEAVWTPDGIQCYFYGGYVALKQIEFDELEKRWTAFLDGLNDIKRLVAAQGPATP